MPGLSEHLREVCGSVRRFVEVIGSAQHEYARILHLCLATLTYPKPPVSFSEYVDIRAEDLLRKTGPFNPEKVFVLFLRRDIDHYAGGCFGVGREETLVGGVRALVGDYRGPELLDEFVYPSDEALPLLRL